ncbi:methyltransferase type 11 [Salinarimonas soli]|uniref:Methyltransferase type 11 n=1 Tax=Salinarimonas soli TaxID=1638099 RepID=A0A5B2VU71_9HYPH|nr:methyltransferase type 11 [Salinarimonas soli]KAA2242334.1 methyltransferase type 11 [Salinarimonas soli]
MSALLCPVSGAPLRQEGPHALAGPAGRWPVVDGIPYLRVGREALVRDTLAALDRGDTESALLLLLADQDDWWTGPAPDEADLRRLVRERSRLTLRDALTLLAFGRVGDYFVHRWSDPTYLAGLALLEAHRGEERTAFELACGIGHYLRELQLRGLEAGGADVVFAKLWIARHWVLPRPAALVCFDAGAPWPVRPRADLALCHDALYFLEPKPEIVERLREIAGETGWFAVGHVHNRENPGFSAGAAMTAAEVAVLLPDAVAYDDAELTRALVEARAPRPRPLGELRAVEAFALAAGPGLKREPRALTGGLILPPDGAPLVRNPLYRDGPRGPEIAWPSERYKAEYAASATYPPRPQAPARAVAGPAVEALARRRELVALPERW